MTGYGAAQRPAESRTVYVSLRAVNSRHLDVRLRLPPELADHAHAVDELARKRLVRGRVELSVRIDEGAGGGPRLDLRRARSAFTQLAGLRDELAPGEPLPLSLLACVPDLFHPAAPAPAASTRAALEEATAAACDALDEMRSREGRALSADLRSRIHSVRGLAARVGARGGDAVTARARRLRQRVERLLHDTQAQLDPGRLEQEVAMLADRADVSEELTRLESHCAQFEALNTEGAEPLGRRLEFLLQEMSREVNTLGSKTADAGASHDVVELKSELERIREQVQNVL